MAKTATTTKIRASRTANAGSKKVDAEDKPKRAPSAYQAFCKEHMKKWNEDNPGRAKEAMAQIAAMWKDAPENPNRGKEVKARKPREPKKAKEPKAKPAKAGSRAKKAKAVDLEDEDEDDAEASASDADAGSD